MLCVLAAGAAVFGEYQFFRRLGFVSLGDVVEVAANSAF